MLQIKSERIKKTYLAISMELFLLCGILLVINTYKQNPYLLYGAVISTFFALLILLGMSLAWMVTNHLSKGIAYAKCHAKTMKQLERELFDAGYYVERTVFNKKCAVIPHIDIILSDDLQCGQIRIRNSIKLDKRLEELPISSALPKEYILTKSYIADDCNDYIYEFELYHLEQLVFSSFEQLLQYETDIGEYDIFLDSRHVVPIFHTLIIGQTGSGKSYCLYNFILQMLTKSTPYELYIADPKYSGLYVLGKKINQNCVASSVEEIINLLRIFQNRMEKRKQEFSKKLLLKLDSDFKDFDLTPICLIIDEYSSFRASLTRYDKKIRDFVDEVIGNVVREGRQLGCFCIIAQQQSNATNLPTEIRENIPFKIILGMAERQTYMTALGVYPDNAKRHFDRGQGILVYPQIATPENPAVTSVATLNFDILKAFEKILDLENVKGD